MKKTQTKKAEGDRQLEKVYMSSKNKNQCGEIKRNKKKKKQKEMPTAPGVPRRSPIQVLTGPDVA